MNYLESFTINDKVVFKGVQLTIKALYDKGAVCRTVPDNELFCIEGLHNLPEVVKCQNGEE